MNNGRFGFQYNLHRFWQPSHVYTGTISSINCSSSDKSEKRRIGCPTVPCGYPDFLNEWEPQPAGSPTMVAFAGR
jgi:hypothetical protein